MFFRRKRPLWSDGAEPVAQQAAPPPRERLSWLEKRDRRRQRRKTFEEVLGWIMVPALVYLVYLGVKAVGGVPKELVDFGNELVGIVLRGG